LNTQEYFWEQVSIYPNPTSEDFLNIKFNTDAKVEVFSIFGKKLIQTTINSSDTSVDISSLSKGIYIVKITHKKLSLSTKIIKI